MNKLVELYRFFDKHRIYLPPEVCTSLDVLIRNVRSQVIHFGVWVRYEDYELTDDSQTKKQEARDAGWDAIKNQVPAAREVLENEFRSLLGATVNTSIKPA